MAQLVENFDQKFAPFGRFEMSFMTILRVKKSHFLDFFKVVSDSIRKFLYTDLELKRATFWFIFSKADK